MPVSVLLFALALTITLSIVLIIHMWRQRLTAGKSALLVAGIMIAVIWWSSLYAFEIMLTDEALKLLCYRAKFLGVVFVPVIWMLFGLQYTGRVQWVVRNRIVLLSIIPILSLVIIWTNDLHHLMWKQLTVGRFGDFSVVVPSSAIWFWVHALYSYCLIMTAFYLLIRQFIGSPALYRRQLIALLLSVAAPFVANAITIFADQPIDFTPFAFAVTGLSLTWGLLRFQLFNLLPVARNLVVDNIMDGVIVLDALGRIVDVNPTAKNIIAPAYVNPIGYHVAHVIEVLGTKLDLAQWNNASAVVQDELRLGQGDLQRVLDVRVSPLYDRRQQLSGRVVIFRDITERKQIEQQIRNQNEALVKANHELAGARQQAEHATQLKSQFLATMSHELRTPLNAVIGYTEIQLAGITGEMSQKQRDFQERVLANALHLLGLINDILDLSRIEAGRMELLLKPFKLRPWLDDIVIQNRVLAEVKNLKVEVDVDPRLPEILIADSERLKQVVINLLSNAVKFTENGSVKVGVMLNDIDTWKIEVIDTGIGIPAHAQETIFEEFRQVDGTSRRQHGGTGLGLAIVRKLVVMMGGHIRLKSEVGQGSTFTITLPLQTESQSAAERINALPMEVQPV